MFNQILFLYVIALSSAVRVSLSGNDWTITDNINYTAQGTVPGTVHTILLAAGKIPDPYQGYNDVDLRYLVKNNWVFTKNFSLTPEFLASNEVSIHLEQIDTVANITINNCPIGNVNNMFRRYIFSFPRGCLRSNNQIQIDFQSPVNYTLEQSIAYGVTIEPTCPPDVQKGECHVQFIRKEPCSFSWDWVREEDLVLSEIKEMLF